MLGRIVTAAAIIALAGCAGVESAGRNASRSPAPARVASAPPPASAATLPPPPTVQSTPPPSTVAATPPAARTQAAAPPPVARTQAAPPPAAPVATASRDDDDDSTVVVPGVRERQVQPPNGDPRSNAERMQDIRAWDQCVMRVQGAAEANPMRPQLDTPEDYCSQSLGMASRTDIPASRLERRR
jgi:hypothetical protein